MRKPQTPPDWMSIFSRITETDPGLLAKYLQLDANILDESSEYYHWDKLRFLTPPEPLTNKQWWAFIKVNRTSNSSKINLPAGQSQEIPRFSFTMQPWIQEILHKIDLQAAGSVAMASPVSMGSTEQHQRYLVRSLVEEAITSSQLEGAATTRLVAKDMIRSKRKPRDENEKMILNNFHAMEYIQEVKHKPISIKRILELHSIISDGIMDDSGKIGRFRQNDELAVVEDAYNEVLHTGINASDIDMHMEHLCTFANEKKTKHNVFIHPIIRAILLHFYLAWIHPFCDGNGRTARALFYWSALRNGYWLLEYTSISEIIRKSRTQYGRAFLYTESDDNDTTYFISYHLHVILQAIHSFHEYIKRTQHRIQYVEQALHNRGDLNYRQLSLLSHALRHPDGRYSFESHATSHKVAIPTARTDLNQLHELGLLEKQRITRKLIYTPVPNIDSAIRSFSLKIM